MGLPLHPGFSRLGLVEEAMKLILILGAVAVVAIIIAEVIRRTRG